MCHCEEERSDDVAISTNLQRLDWHAPTVETQWRLNCKSLVMTLERRITMLALIDNYNSFTYNLVQYLGELGAEIRVFRNDQISLDELIALKPDHLVVSPGPGEPIKDGGVSPEAVKHFTGKIPVLGVCLGHQCLGAIYGGKVDRAARLMHGKTSSVNHNGQGIFKDIPSPFEGMRYHSLIVHEPVPAELEVLATTSEGEIMALKHREHPTYGVQFHPESILTEHGKKLLKNFLDLKPAPIAGGEQAMLKPFIAKAINRTDLTADEAEEAMNIIMTGQATPAQIGAYLVALRMKGETIPEITGSVRAMRANAVKVQLSQTGRILSMTSSAPAAMARTPSTSPPPRRSSWRAQGAKLPSMATVLPHPNAALQMSSLLSASTWT